MLKPIITVIFTILLCSVVNTAVRAQVSLLDPEEYRNTKAQIITQYSDQIQAYQAEHRKYKLAEVQYRQLGSLVAMGELTEAARQTMLRRGEVMLSYLDLLHLELRFVSNVNGETKRGLLDKIELLHRDLDTQQTLISNSQDYQAINVRAEGFEGLYQQLQPVVFETKAIIFLSKINVFDRLTRNYFDQIQQQFTQFPKTGLAAVERQRARDEIEAAILKLTEFQKDVAELEQPKNKTLDQGWYAQYIAKLGKVQNQLIFVLNYLEEASKL